MFHYEVHDQLHASFLHLLYRIYSSDWPNNLKMTPHVLSPFCSDPYCSKCDFRLCGAAYDLDGVEQQVKELRHWKEEETGPKEVLAKGQGTFRTP